MDIHLIMIGRGAKRNLTAKKLPSTPNGAEVFPFPKQEKKEPPSLLAQLRAFTGHPSQSNLVRLHPERSLPRNLFAARQPQETEKNRKRAFALASHKIDLSQAREVSRFITSDATYRKKDPQPVKVVKTILLRRFAMEALSRSWINYYERDPKWKFEERKYFAEQSAVLLKQLDRFFFKGDEEILRPFAYPKNFLDREYRLVGYLLRCRPEKGESQEVLNHKLQAALDILVYFISKNIAPGGPMCEIIKDFDALTIKELCAGPYLVFKAHQDHPLTHPAVKECIRLQILETTSGLPFNIIIYPDPRQDNLTTLLPAL